MVAEMWLLFQSPRLVKIMKMREKNVSHGVRPEKHIKMRESHAKCVRLGVSDMAINRILVRVGLCASNNSLIIAHIRDEFKQIILGLWSYKMCQNLLSCTRNIVNDIKP